MSMEYVAVIVLICVCLILLGAGKEKPINWIVCGLSTLAMLITLGVFFTTRH